MKRYLIGLLVLLAACATRSPPAPIPAAMPETIPKPPPSPVPLTWQPGHWDWTGRSYVWVPGQYVDRNGQGTSWMPPYWQETDSGWTWQPGHWM
jgi:WXXGXW repeat (2 copies)